MLVQIRFSATIRNAESSSAVAMLEVDPTAVSRVLHSRISLSPDMPAEFYLDIYGNPCRRLLSPEGLVRVSYDACVELTPSVRPNNSGAEIDLFRVPVDVLLYTLPSRYCPSDEFVAIAQDLFGSGRADFCRVQDIHTWINEHVRYEYGHSDASTSARETFFKRAGVCRDFTHLGVAFCRALNIPARYCSGYCLGLEPQDLHAYFQAYVGDSWVDFDATSSTPRPGLIRIAAGRDAADCAWWTVFGTAMTEELSVQVSAVE